MRAAGLGADEAFDRAAGGELEILAVDERDRADKARSAVAAAGGVEHRVDLRELLGIARLDAAEAGGLHAGLAIERIDFEPRVLGDRRQAVAAA